jgi:gliding motility-associated-like protein
VEVSNGGCTDSACVTVTVDLSCGELFVPNAFSPNNDNQNDELKVLGRCISEIYFAVYDRWGEKVFETTSQNVGWDGTYRGKVMNSAVFVYYLDATLVTGEQIIKKGNISLVR